MAIVERVKQICFSPQTEWPVIAAESATPATLISGYAAPLAAIGAVAGFIGGSIIGRTVPFVGTYHVGLTAGLAGAVLSFVMAIVSVAILAVVINLLAPTFDAQKDSNQAWKLAVYSYTPAWVAGVLQLLPLLGVLAILAALYGIYLMYVGLPTLMKCPKEKAAGYTAVVVICAVVVSIVAGLVVTAATGLGVVGAGAIGGLTGSASAPVRADPNSALGKLADLGAKLDESNKKMDAAQKAGDTNGQVAAAMEGLGTILGGGKHVEPVDIDQLKPLVPDTFAGLPKTSANAEKNGFGGLMVSKAEATYGNDSKNVHLEIDDSGGMSGLVGLASWTNVQQDSEDASGFERTQQVNGRMVHEKMSKTGGTNEYGVIVGGRFMVEATSDNVDLDTLKSAVSSLDLDKLDAMKNVGVQK